MKTITILLVMFLGGLAIDNRVATATPSSDLTYIETELTGGWWQYDYCLSNNSDPVADAGFDLYDLFIAFDPSFSINIISLPTGWGYLDGAGFIDTYSENPGVPSVGTDISPGTSLSGFCLRFSDRVGSLAYDATFTDPSGGNPLVLSGVSGPESSPVPEPATMVLMGVGLVGLAGTRIKRKK